MVPSRKVAMIGQEMVRLRDPLGLSFCYRGHERLEPIVALDSGERHEPNTLPLG